MRPATIVHCDWSVYARKRWLTAAQMRPDGSYNVCDPMPVGPLETFFARLCDQTSTGPILAGFDFPIGLPRYYAARARISRFPDALLGFGRGEWAGFYEPAETPNQISLARPFYPRRPGGTKKQHLTDGLGLQSVQELLRECDHPAQGRGKACELFWTLGANQVGRAAIAGWRDLLAPALRANRIVIWPFDGDLAALLPSGRIVVAETYPAEFYGHLGLDRGFGKRSREGRRGQARQILLWCNDNDLMLAPQLAAAIEDGFGCVATAEDIFDSVIGLLGMVEVVRDFPAFAIPANSAVRNIEGWILGLRADRTHSAPHPAADGATGRPLEHGSRRIAQRPGASPASPHCRLCPACKQKLFTRWPWGWDAHAAYTCSGVSGGTPEERKRLYRQQYLTV